MAKKKDAGRVDVMMLTSMSGQGYTYKPKDLVSVLEATAEKWVEGGLCTLDIPEPKVYVHPVERAAATEEEVLAAIAKMDPKKDFDGSRRPDLAKLEDALDKCVGINMRNACFDTYQSQLRQKKRDAAGSTEAELVEE